jgi:hypothetical protein
MFSEQNDEIIDYHIGSKILYPANRTPIDLKARENNTFLMCSYMEVYQNCETACDSAMLKDHPDRKAILKSSHYGQAFLKKTLTLDTFKFDSCIKKCFSK